MSELLSSSYKKKSMQYVGTNLVVKKVDRHFCIMDKAVIIVPLGYVLYSYSLTKSSGNLTLKFELVAKSNFLKNP